MTPSSETKVNPITKAGDKGVAKIAHPPTEVGDEEVAQRSLPPRRAQTRKQVLTRYGVLATMAVTFATFSTLRPSSFLTVVTIHSIFRDLVPLFIVSIGVTVVLIMKEFDLSVAGLTALCATSVAMLVSTEYVGLSPALAVAVVVLIGAGCGMVNGILIAYFRAPAFIFTIAMGTVFSGAALALSDSMAVYQGIPEGYSSLGGGELFGVSNQIWIGLGVLVVAHVFLTHSVWGRYMYAVGGNPLTAALSGIRVPRFKAAGFSLVGVAAAVTAVLLTSQVGAANPNTGLGLLLPAYAAAFLGASMFRVGVFSALGTALGALYLQMIGTGLTILNFTGPMVQVVQGGILAGAILLATAVRR